MQGIISYIEDIRPNDTLSLKNFTPKFLSIADSISRTETIDEERFQKLKKKRLSVLNSDDFAILAKAYLMKRDRANYSYCNYLKVYGFPEMIQNYKIVTLCGSTCFKEQFM